MTKIVLGTANFNQFYGISKSKICKNEIKKKIFPIIKKNKIQSIDTAIDYNISKNILKSQDFSKFKIFSKIKLPKTGKKIFIKKIPKLIEKEKKKFNVKKLEGLLIHNLNDLKSRKYGEDFLIQLKNLKRNKIISKIGISLYNPKDIKFISKKFIPEIVQIPMNVFDQRILISDELKYIKKQKISLQVRSVFLQGILLKSYDKIQKTNINSNLKHKIVKFRKWCDKNQISPIFACMNFLKNCKFIDSVVVGFDDSRQLIEIIKEFKKKKKNYNYKKFSLNNTAYIDPRKW